MQDTDCSLRCWCVCAWFLIIYKCQKDASMVPFWRRRDPAPQVSLQSSGRDQTVPQAERVSDWSVSLSDSLRAVCTERASERCGSGCCSWQTLTEHAQNRALAPWFSNSDQASLSSMKIILAYCSYGWPVAWKTRKQVISIQFLDTKMRVTPTERIRMQSECNSVELNKKSEWNQNWPYLFS